MEKSSETLGKFPSQVWLKWKWKLAELVGRIQLDWAQGDAKVTPR